MSFFQDAFGTQDTLRGKCISKVKRAKDREGPSPGLSYGVGVLVGFKLEQKLVPRSKGGTGTARALIYLLQDTNVYYSGREVFDPMDIGFEGDVGSKGYAVPVFEQRVNGSAGDTAYRRRLFNAVRQPLLSRLHKFAIVNMQCPGDRNK